MWFVSKSLPFVRMSVGAIDGFGALFASFCIQGLCVLVGVPKGELVEGAIFSPVSLHLEGDMVILVLHGPPKAERLGFRCCISCPKARQGTETPGARRSENFNLRWVELVQGHQVHDVLSLAFTWLRGWHHLFVVDFMVFRTRGHSPLPC